jgi:hypothetical protein
MFVAVENVHLLVDFAVRKDVVRRELCASLLLAMFFKQHRWKHYEVKQGVYYDILLRPAPTFTLC